MDNFTTKQWGCMGEAQPPPTPLPCQAPENTIALSLFLLLVCFIGVGAFKDAMHALDAASVQLLSFVVLGDEVLTMGDSLV